VLYFTGFASNDATALSHNSDNLVEIAVDPSLIATDKTLLQNTQINILKCTRMHLGEIPEM